jgi:hypothetical protein
MSRINLGACCILLSFLCLNSLVEVVAQESDPFAQEGGYVQELGGGRVQSVQFGGHDFEGRGGEMDGGRGGFGRGGGPGMAGEMGMGMEMSAAQRIESVLQQPLTSPLQYEDQPLNEIVEALSQEYELPILIDQRALENFGMSPDVEVSVNLRNMSLRSALNLILRQPALEDLVYTIDNEVLMITTEEYANDRLTVAIYRVDDLVEGESQWASSDQRPYTPLVNVITKCVEQNSWAVNGQGLGQIHLMEPGILVVSQTKTVQDEIVSFLDKLRATRKDMEQTTEQTAAE